MPKQSTPSLRKDFETDSRAMAQTEPDLLNAICSDPDNDGPRLQYADWLEEQGDWARSRFIRIQCTLSGNASLPSDEREKAQLQEAEYLAAYGGAWGLPLKELGAANYVFHRGCPEEITIYAASLLSHADQLFTLAPLRKLHLLIPDLKQMERVVNCRQLQRIRSLDAASNWIGNRGASLLAASPYLGSLETLNLAANSISDEGAHALAGGQSLRNLRKINLSANQVGADGAKAIAASSSSLPRLTELDLDGNLLTERQQNSITEMLQARLDFKPEAG